MEGGNRRTLQVLELILQLNDRHIAGAMHTVRRQRLRARKVVAAAVLAHRLQGAIWPPRRLALVALMVGTSGSCGAPPSAARLFVNKYVIHSQ